MKDVVVRAIKTFIQAAISYVCTISFIDIDWSDNTVVGGVILAALAAGISALMNIDWDAISLEKAAEEVNDEAEDDTDTEDDVNADDAVDLEEEDAAEDADADEPVEDEIVESDAAAEADAEDEGASDDDTAEVETEKACG